MIAQVISSYLGALCGRIEIKTYKSTDSTNRLAKVAASLGVPEGYTVISNEQTCGYGRRGRAFFSPSGSGIYLSLVLRPRISPESSLLITTVAAVAVSGAIESVFGIKAEIKWVNDILVNGKKVAGILTEASFTEDGKSIDRAILGIGINLCPPEDGFPSEIQDIAGSILSSPDCSQKEHFIAELLKRFFGYYDALPDIAFFDEYKNRLAMLGKTVSVIKKDGASPAKAVGISNSFNLIVEYEDGRTEALSSGEVSTRLL